jgi:antitoxin ChpS
MSFATVQKMDGSLVVVLPPELQQELQLAEGTQLEMRAEQGRVNVRRRKYTLKELLDQCDFSIPMSDEEREWIDAPRVGRELI